MQRESRKVSDGHRIHDDIFWNSPAHLWQWMDKPSSHIPGKAWWLAKCLHFPRLGENLHSDGRALEWIKEAKGFLCKPQKHLMLSEIFLHLIDVLLASLNRTKEHPEARKRAAQNFPLKECIWAGHSWVVRLQLHIGLRYSFSMHQHLIADNPASPCPRKEGLEQGNHYHSKIYLPASWDCSHWMTPCDCKGPVLSPEDGTEFKAHTDAKTPLRANLFPEISISLCPVNSVTLTPSRMSCQRAHSINICTQTSISEAVSWRLWSKVQGFSVVWPLTSILSWGRAIAYITWTF